MLDETIRILLVEDNPGDVRLLEEMLGSAQDAPAYSLATARTLAEAIHALEQDPARLCLLDLGLPDSQGLATCEELVSRFPHVTTVVLTGDRDTDLGIETVRRGAQDFLVKARMNGAALWRVISYSIERARLLEDARQRSLIDPVTGLYNRHGFESVADQHLRLAGRAQKGVFCLYVEVEGLERIHARRGFRSGDLALETVGMALRAIVRRSDVLARIEGPHFVVFGIETGGAYSEAVAERLDQALIERIRLANLGFSVEVRFGLARAEDATTTSLRQLIDAADAHLAQKRRADG